jgi:hypothetical protein
MTEEELDWEEEWEGEWGGELPPERGIAVGWLAALPLALAYEWSRMAPGTSELRNSAEVLLTLPLAPLGPVAELVRALAVVAAGAFAVAWLLRREVPVAASALRTVRDGVFAAFLLSPLLVLLLGVFDAPETGPLGNAPGANPPLAELAFHGGAGLWEELLFRVLLYGGLALLARQTAAFLGLTRTLVPWVGEAAALFGSSLLFAAFHLESWTAPLGGGGEPFDLGLFVWRALAGALLGVLRCWRGFGAAAWAHAAFNVALALGAGPRGLA